MMRWAAFLPLVVLGCSSSSTVRKEHVATPIVSTNVQVTNETPLLEPTPTPTERLASILDRLVSSTEPETLLLGIEVVPSEGYGPLYGEGAQAPPEDKLRTLVIRVDGGRVELAGELPFLAIPHETGFLYMGVASYGRDDTEAEKKRQGAKFGLDDELGNKVYWYVASSLWRTKDRAQVDAARTKARKSLEKHHKWGHFSAEELNYVTSHAMCSTSSYAEWTGGAQAFMAHETESLTGLSKNVPQALSNYTDDAALLRFVHETLQRRDAGEDDEEISLDKPVEIFGYKIDWRKGSRACLKRENGGVMLTGIIELPNNGARTSEWETSLREAPPELASNAPPPIEMLDIQRAFVVPKPQDVVVSPKKTVLIVKFPDRLVVYGAGSTAPLLSIPMIGRIVMAEWERGEIARSWDKVGDRTKPVNAPTCACELGQVCLDSKCVKPKSIFVTGTLYSGNLGGLDGADAKCQDRAKAGGLSGQFKAWLSDSTISAAARLTHANAPYVLVDGTLVAKDWAELTSGRLQAPIMLTEFVRMPTVTSHPSGCGTFLVWTNSKEDGSMVDKNRSCSNWTDGTSSPSPDRAGTVLGEAESESLWSSECKSRLAACNGSFPLYCIEQ
jgi:hypothetical protein